MVDLLIKMDRARGARGYKPRERPSGRESQPAVLGPFDFLDRRFPTEHRFVVGLEWTRTEMGHVPLTRRRIYQTSVSRLLQIGVRVVQLRAQKVVIVPAEVRGGIARQERIDRSGLVRTGDVAGARQRHAVPVSGAALGRHQVIEPVPPVQVRRLKTSAVGASAVDASGWAAQFLVLGLVLLENDGARVFVAIARVPLQSEEPMTTIVVVEEGRVETDAVEIHRPTPRTIDI